MGDTLPNGADLADVMAGTHDWTETLGETLTLPKAIMDLLATPPTSQGGPLFDDLLRFSGARSGPSWRRDRAAKDNSAADRPDAPPVAEN